MEMPENGTPATETAPKAKPSKLAWLWPVITTEEEAKKAARTGAYAAAFIAALTCVISLIAIGTKESLLRIDGWGLVDGALFTIVAWRIFKFSFSWAIAGLLLYFAETCWRWNTVGPPKSGGIITTGVIVLALIAGVRGTAFLNKGRVADPG